MMIYVRLRLFGRLRFLSDTYVHDLKQGLIIVEYPAWWRLGLISLLFSFAFLPCFLHTIWPYSFAEYTC